MLRIVVCVKQVIDPEAPASAFQVDADERRIVPPKGVPPVLNPFDENALEAALRIRDAQDVEIVVLSMGRSLARPVLKKSLAAGADTLILLEDDAFQDLDSFSTANVLTAAIRKLEGYDLVLCGRQAADTDAGEVGSGIAELLGIPSITAACKVEVDGEAVRVERMVSDGYEIVEAPMPALVTASNEIGALRFPAMKDVMAAQKKPTTVWNAEELGVEPSGMKRVRLLRLFTPAHRQGQCEMVEAETPEQAGENLALKLRETKLL